MAYIYVFKVTDNNNQYEHIKMAQTRMNFTIFPKIYIFGCLWKKTSQ